MYYFKCPFSGVGVWEGTQIDEMPNFRVRNDDVWVCSFPRSGKYTEVFLSKKQK